MTKWWMSPRSRRRWRPRTMDLAYFLIVFFVTIAGSSSVNDCHSVRYAYLAKGLDLKDVPRQPRQGSQLEICPRGLTCCTEEMERKLRSVSKEQYGKAIGSAADSMQRFFNNRANKFNDVFPELMSASKLNFHRLFRKTYGIIYIKNSDVFTDFFKDLDLYYNHGHLDLEEALDRFFASLYQRMFTVFNAQYKFDSRYLTCVSQTMRTLQPFGDVPQKLSQQLRQSFVATRTFNQALISGKKILNKIVKIQPKDRCVIALTKMSSCPACEGFTEIKPCGDYCVNVMKGCLAYHAEFGNSWDKYLDNLRELADRMKGPFDIEEVVDPIGVKISDAIMNFQRSGYEVSEKVKQECGTPRIQKREAIDESKEGYLEVFSRQRRRAKKGRRGGGGKKRGEKVSKLKSLVDDIRDTVPAYKGFWTRLPATMCKGQEGGSGSQGKCWNGQSVHTGGRSGDGDVSKVDVARFDSAVYEQVQAVKAVNKKMTKAIKGQRVEWTQEDNAKDYSTEDYGGSGDGGEGTACHNSDDEDCYSDAGSGDANGSGDYDDNDDSEAHPQKEPKVTHDHVVVDPAPAAPPATPKPTPIDIDVSNDIGGGGGSDDEYADNWPPWVTASAEEEVKVIDTNDIYRQQPHRTSGAASRMAAVVYFVVPVVTCMVGSLFV